MEHCTPSCLLIIASFLHNRDVCAWRETKMYCHKQLACVKNARRRCCLLQHLLEQKTDFSYQQAILRPSFQVLEYFASFTALCDLEVTGIDFPNHVLEHMPPTVTALTFRNVSRLATFNKDVHKRSLTYLNLTDVEISSSNFASWLFPSTLKTLKLHDTELWGIHRLPPALEYYSTSAKQIMFEPRQLPQTLRKWKTSEFDKWYKAMLDEKTFPKLTYLKVRNYVRDWSMITKIGSHLTCLKVPFFRMDEHARLTLGLCRNLQVLELDGDVPRTVLCSTLVHLHTLTLTNPGSSKNVHANLVQCTRLRFLHLRGYANINLAHLPEGLNRLQLSGEKSIHCSKATRRLPNLVSLQTSSKELFLSSTSNLPFLLPFLPNLQRLGLYLEDFYYSFYAWRDVQELTRFLPCLQWIVTLSPASKILANVRLSDICTEEALDHVLDKAYRCVFVSEKGVVFS